MEQGHSTKGCVIAGKIGLVEAEVLTSALAFELACPGTSEAAVRHARLHA